MKKQLLTILGMLLMMMVAGNVIGQGGPSGPPTGEPEGKKGANEGSPAIGVCYTDKVLISQIFDPAVGLIAPQHVSVLIKKAPKNGPMTQIQLTYPNFQYARIDYRFNEATFPVDEISYCGSSNIEGDVNPFPVDIEYEFYEITVMAQFSPTHITTNTSVLVANGRFAHSNSGSPNPISNFVGVPNPFSTNLAIQYSLNQVVDGVGLHIHDGMGNQIMSVTHNLPNTSGDHNYFIGNTTQWGNGTYIATLFIEKAGKVEQRTITLIKQ